MSTHPSILAWKTPWTRGTWWDTAHGVTKSQTQLNDWAHTHAHTTEGRYVWTDILGFSFLPYYCFCRWMAPEGSDLLCGYPISPYHSAPQQRGKILTWPHLQLKYNSMSTDVKQKKKKRFIGQIWKIIWKQVSYDICYNRAIIIHFQESRVFFFFFKFKKRCFCYLYLLESSDLNRQWKTHLWREIKGFCTISSSRSEPEHNTFPTPWLKTFSFWEYFEDLLCIYLHQNTKPVFSPF